MPFLLAVALFISILGVMSILIGFTISAIIEQFDSFDPIGFGFIFFFIGLLIVGYWFEQQIWINYIIGIER